MTSKKKEHEHHKCEHTIEFCAPCNEAYCTKCELVFTSEPCTLNHFPNWSYLACNLPHFNEPYIYPTWTTTTTGIAGGSSSSDSIIMNDPQSITLTAHSSHRSC